MSVKEAKLEIINILEEIPDDSIFELLELIRELKNLSQLDTETSAYLIQIMREDDDLLKELAK